MAIAPSAIKKTSRTELVVKDNSAIVADARVRIANQNNLDALFKPPALKRKIGHAPEKVKTILFDFYGF